MTMAIRKKTGYLVYTMFVFLCVGQSDGGVIKESTSSTKQFDENRLLTPLPQWFTEDGGAKAFTVTTTIEATPPLPTTTFTGQPAFEVTAQTPNIPITGSTVTSSLGNDTSTSTTNAAGQYRAFYSYTFVIIQCFVIVYQ